MSRPRRSNCNFAVAFVLLAGLAGSMISGCSGSGSTTTPPPPTTSNVQSISVSVGPAAAVGTPAIDSAFTSVTICAPGSATRCQTVSGILVDTGSSGLRVLASVLTVSLPQMKDSNSNSIAECAQFEDGQSWGPVQMADISMAGEKASSLAIQVIGSASFPTVPGSCSSLGPVEDDLAGLGANGILGVGNFVQDCGPGCASSGQSNAGFYYACPMANNCQITAQAAAQQVSNPVAFFASDNNGVIIELPAVSAPAASISGSMIFGIGTQSNNGLGSAKVYTLDPDLGNLTTSLNGQTYTDASFFDTGSNAIYFLDAATTGLPTCNDYTFLYCPTSTKSFSATNLGVNGVSGSVDFEIDNADTLVANPSVGVAPNLGGPNPGGFDWGLPFFFGRNVYTAIDGKSTPGGTGPYVAY